MNNRIMNRINQHISLFLKGTGIIFVYIFLASCEKEVDYNGQLPGPKISLTSFVEADSIIKAEVYSSWTIAEEKGRPMKDAIVALYINGEFKENMNPAYPNVMYPTHISNFRAKTGDRVRMEVTKGGYPDAISETVVPGKTTILSVDTVVFYQMKDNYYSGPTTSPTMSMRCLIKIKDPEPGKKNYYRLILRERSEHSTTGYPDASYSSVNSRPFDYEQEAVMKEGFSSTTDEVMGTDVPNEYRIFSDDIFDGKEYTLNISFDYPAYSSRFEIRPGVIDEYIYSYEFILISLTESAYQFMRSYTHYQYMDEGPLTEPVSVFNNISGGLGILGAFNSTVYQLVMPEKPWKEYYYNESGNYMNNTNTESLMLRNGLK